MKALVKERGIKKTKGDIVFGILNYAVFGLFTLICFYPFYYLIINSVSANDLSSNGSINFLPSQLHLENYKQVLQLKGLGLAALVSVGRTIIGTICTVLASAFLGFMFTQERMWRRKLWYRLMVVTMYFNAGLIPMFLTMQNLHLTNSFWVYVIPVIVQPFNIILVKTYMESIPRSLQEAAEIDGAGIMKVFLKIILPTSTPILATIAIFAAVAQWNSFQDTLIYVTDQKLYSLQYILYQYINQANSLATMVKNSSGGTNLNMAALATQQTPTSIRMTVSVIVVMPILFIYPMFQRYSEAVPEAQGQQAAESVSGENSKYEEFLTVDVFDSQANYQGIQSGWFAKIVKDKFNMELNIIAPNVAGGGDTLFQTRSAAGNLGDLIFTSADRGRLQDLVTAGLVMDMTDLIKGEENLERYRDAIEYSNKELVEEEGIYMIPSEVTTLSPTTPMEGTDCNSGVYLRWDLYEELGCPELNTVEDMLDVLKEMQELCPESDSGKKTYAFSLFKDWDDNAMKQGAWLPSLYGYRFMGDAVYSADDSLPPQSLVDENSVYVRNLKLFFTANQMGLMDPESTTQNYDTLYSKYKDGAVLFSPWPWLLIM